MSVGEGGIYSGDVSMIQRSLNTDRNIIATARSSRIIRIREHPELLVYLGKERDHVVIDRSYCSCTAFIISTGDGNPKGCKHLAAAVIATEKGWMIDVSRLIGDGDAVRITWEVLTGEFTMTLRRILHKHGITR